MEMCQRSNSDPHYLQELTEDEIQIVLQLRHLSQQGYDYMIEQMAIASEVFARGIPAAALAA